MIHKPTVNQIVAAEQQQIIEEDTVGKGRDLDAESTCQNFNKVARKGDISPRFMEKGKSAGKRKAKQVKGFLTSNQLGSKQGGLCLNPIFRDECSNMEH